MPQNRPTVYLVIDLGFGDPYNARSAMAYDERGEIVETVEWTEAGEPIWDDAGCCDHRGMGGPEGFSALVEALDAGERNARLGGVDVMRVKV